MDREELAKKIVLRLLDGCSYFSIGGKLADKSDDLSNVSKRAYEIADRILRAMKEAK